MDGYLSRRGALRKIIQDYYNSITTLHCAEIKRESLFSILYNKIEQIIDDTDKE
jgi:hypothetical protein